jgi:hypothetical protein
MKQNDDEDIFLFFCEKEEDNDNEEHGRMMSACMPALFFLCNFMYLSNCNYNQNQNQNVAGG